MTRAWPVLGCGVGLRTPHYETIRREWPRVDWFEAISENFMDSGGRPLQILEAVRSRYPVALHGVSLSIGSTDPLNETYLARLKALADRVDPAIISDHLCWTGVEGEQLHDLLPLPFTEESLRHVVARVGRVQDALGRRILLENVSSYVTYAHSTMPEWEFLRAVAERSGCGILLDLNNVYVNAANHRFDPRAYLAQIPGELVGQFHLAGHTDMGAYLFDTHSRPVIEPVWALYREALVRWGQVSTLIEWDEEIPPFARLAEEAEKARAIMTEVCGSHQDAPGYGLRAVGNCPEPRTLNPEPRGEPSLVVVQRWFKECLRPQRAGDASRIGPFLNPQGGEPGERRLSVYAGGYVVRIREALAEVYEATRWVLGGPAFDRLAEAYGTQHPSRDYNLSVVGRHLPEFLTTQPLTQRLPFLPDLARLEWSVCRAFHAFEQPPMEPAEVSRLSSADGERLRVVFQPSVAVVGSAWPILDLWASRKRPPQDVDIPLVNRPQHVLVSRRGVEVRCEAMTREAARVVEGLLSGKTLGAVCQELAGAAPEAAAPQIAEWFAMWRQAGLIVTLVEMREGVC